MRTAKSLLGVAAILFLLIPELRAQAIFDAVQSNDLVKVRALIGKDASLLNAKDKTGDSPLHHAARTGSVEIVEFLLSQGADINSVNAQVNTPFYEAVISRKENISELLFVNSYAQQRDFPVLKGPYLGQKPPGRTPELFAPGIISTCSQHSSVYFSRDGKEVYFSRMVPLPSVIMYMREENGQWTTPRVVCEGLTPGLAPDGKAVFFSTWKLFRLFKTPEGWTQPELLPPHVNFQKRQDTPYAAADGTLYFCSMFGKADGIYRARLTNGEYIQPEKIEYGISKGSGNFSPYIAPDQSYLVFASNRPGYGIQDLYVSFHNEDGSWTQPKNMGPGINTAAKEAFPFVSFDGKYLFFMSNRVSELNNARIPDGPGNVYWVDARIIEDLKPEDLK